MAPHSSTRLENPMDRGAWWATVHGVAKSWTRLSDLTFTHWRRKWQPTPVFLPGESQGRGAWWAAVYGVAQSWTQLKRLSSSSSSFLDWSFDHYVVYFFVSFYSLCFKVYFIWYESCYSCFLWSLFAWNIFFQPFTFSLYVSPILRWVSCRQHMQGLVFVSIQPVFVFWLGHSTHLCLR